MGQLQSRRLALDWNAEKRTFPESATSQLALRNTVLAAVGALAQAQHHSEPPWGRVLGNNGQKPTRRNTRWRCDRPW